MSLQDQRDRYQFLYRISRSTSFLYRICNKIEFYELIIIIRYFAKYKSSGSYICEYARIIIIFFNSNNIIIK